MRLSTQMARKRPLRLKRIRKIERVSKAGPVIVRRAEFDALIKLLNERGEIVNDRRRELELIYRELADDVLRAGAIFRPNSPESRSFSKNSTN